MAANRIIALTSVVSPALVSSAARYGSGVACTGHTSL
jgi:hypothetical protein